MFDRLNNSTNGLMKSTAQFSKRYKRKPALHWHSLPICSHKYDDNCKPMYLCVPWYVCLFVCVNVHTTGDDDIRRRWAHAVGAGNVNARTIHFEQHTQSNEWLQSADNVSCYFVYKSNTVEYCGSCPFTELLSLVNRSSATALRRCTWC